MFVVFYLCFLNMNLNILILNKILVNRGADKMFYYFSLFQCPTCKTSCFIYGI